MKKDYQWAIWLIIALFSVLAASCGEQPPTTFEKHTVRMSTRDSLYANTYPYEWDKITYNLVRHGNHAEWDSVQTKVWFNEEYIDVNGVIFDEGAIWVNKHTFQSDSSGFTIKVTPMSMQIVSNKYGLSSYYRK